MSQPPRGPFDPRGGWLCVSKGLEIVSAQGELEALGRFAALHGKA